MPPPFQGTRTEEELTASWTGWDRKGWRQGPRSSFGDELLLSQARERLATAPGIQCSRSWVAFERRNKKIPVLDWCLPEGPQRRPVRWVTVPRPDSKEISGATSFGWLSAA